MEEEEDTKKSEGSVALYGENRGCGEDEIVVTPHFAVLVETSFTLCHGNMVFIAANGGVEGWIWKKVIGHGGI